MPLKKMRLNIRRWLVLTLLLGAFAFSGCTAADTASSGSSQSDSAQTVAPTPSPQAAERISAGDFGLPILAGEATVELVINGSPVVIQVDGENAPITAGNFVDLVQRGVYDELAFHRVIRQPEPFVAQGGDPLSRDSSVSPRRLGTGSFIDPDTGNPRYIPLEIKPVGADTPIYNQTFEMAGLNQSPLLTHTRGAVAMARSQLPDSASSQFYFALADLPSLDGSYAVFGYVTAGMDVVDQIQQGDVIASASVTAGLDNLRPKSETGSETGS